MNRKNNKLLILGYIVFAIVIVNVITYSYASVYDKSGDVNGDNIIDINDVRELARYIINDTSEISYDNLLLGDMNDDGQIKINDVIMLLIAIRDNNSPIQEPVENLEEGLLMAYATAASNNNGTVTSTKFKGELNNIFGAEGNGYTIIDNGLSWLVEVPSLNEFAIISYEGSIENYITPENDCGAVGDGITDDTAAIRTCMQSNVQNVVLTGTYLMTQPVQTSVEKHIFKGKILCEVHDWQVFRFDNKVRFNNTSFTSSIHTTGISAHSETFYDTSNLDFVEIWGSEARFTDCEFENAVRAIRGRITTGGTVVPQRLYVNNTTFNDCKAPIQGYFAYVYVDNSHFYNDGDLYSGDHAIYIDSFGSEEINVTNTLVETYNTESGLAFQTYGKRSGQTNTPKINVSNCVIKANGIASSDLAQVTVTNTSFVSQSSHWNVFTIEEGSILIADSNIIHTRFIANYQDVPVVANNSTFKLDVTAGERAYFPTEATNVKFINWGGVVIYDNTQLNNCVFTRDTDHVVGKYYIGFGSGSSVSIINSAFKAGDNISYNSSGLIYLKDCHYVNNIGLNVTNVIEEGTIAEDIVD